jgi:hypothetical protein
MDIFDSSGSKIGNIGGSPLSPLDIKIIFSLIAIQVIAGILYNTAMEGVWTGWQAYAEPYRTILGAYYWIATKPGNAVIYGGRVIWYVLTSGWSWYEVTRFPNLNTLIAVVAIAAYAAILLTLTWLLCRLMRTVAKLQVWLALFVMPALFCLLWLCVSGIYSWLFAAA